MKSRRTLMATATMSVVCGMHAGFREAVGAPGVDGADDLQEELRRLELEVQTLRKRLTAADAHEKELEKQIAEINQNVAGLRREIADLAEAFVGDLQSMNPVLEESAAGWRLFGRNCSIHNSHLTSPPPLQVNQRRYEHGIGTNTWSRLVYETRGIARQFDALCGIDDTSTVGSHVRGARFLVTGWYSSRNVTKWNSLPGGWVDVWKGDDPKPISISILHRAAYDVQRIRLSTFALDEKGNVIDGEVKSDRDRWNHTDWLLARLTR